MKLQRIAIVLTTANFVLLVFLVSQFRPAAAQGTAPVLRGRALEIVDGQGTLRAFLGVLPGNPNARMPSGKPVPETVILRLMDPRTGRPSVKLATSEQGSGLGLLGESKTEETWVILEAEAAESFLRLRNEGQAERRIQR